jgi:hypothetical protein
MNPHLELLLSRAYDGALAPEHHADLEKSALGQDIIAEQFIRSIPPNLIPKLLGFDIPAIRSAMLLPFRAAAGGFMDHVRLKIFPTLVKIDRKEQDGRTRTRWIAESELLASDTKHETIKYLQPRGSAPRLYFIQRCLRDVLESSAPVWLCEGEKKALYLAATGLPVVGFCGVEGWHLKGSRDLIADFDAIRLRDRIVEVLPDGDYRSNDNVKRAIRRFGVALAERGARPRAVLLPNELSR